METMEKIAIWESNAESIRACERAVIQALKELGLEATIIINAEPPLISRNQLWGRLPALEIRGQFWSLTPGKPFTKEQVVKLFKRLFIVSSDTASE